METANGKRAWKPDQVYEGTETTNVRDHCNLEVLNAATLLENTRERFMCDSVYTFISEILIAVNPFKAREMSADARAEIVDVAVAAGV